MGEYDNSYSNLTDVAFHSTGINPTPYNRIHNFNNVSFDDALVSAWAEAEKQVQIMAEPISITTSNTFSEKDWDSVIDHFGYRTCYIPQGDRQPIKIAFGEPYIVGVDMANTGWSVIQRIETPYIVYEDDEDCGDCAELNEFLDSLQKKCDEAI